MLSVGDDDDEDDGSNERTVVMHCRSCSAIELGGGRVLHGRRDDILGEGGYIMPGACLLSTKSTWLETNTLSHTLHCARSDVRRDVIEGKTRARATTSLKSTARGELKKKGKNQN